MTLKTLNVAYNGFALRGATALAEALEMNDVLLDLDLTCNRIFDGGAARLAKALATNETLQCLRVRGVSAGMERSVGIFQACE